MLYVMYFAAYEDILPGLKNEVKGQIKKVLQTLDFVAITENAWTIRTCTSFVITSHFLSKEGQTKRRGAGTGRRTGSLRPAQKGSVTR